MHRLTTLRPLTSSVIAASAVFLAACSQKPVAPPSAAPTEASAATSAAAAHSGHATSARNARAEEKLTAAQFQAIADVRKATTQFHDLDAAIAAKYSVQFPAGCAASAEGAQGFHYLNEGLVDDKVELLRPELVMYEPGPNGQRNLVGVDYIVPLALSDTPPVLLGQEFAPLGPPLNVWALHIWAWRPNPSGMFALWNPKVSCEHAGIAPRN